MNRQLSSPFFAALVTDKDGTGDSASYSFEEVWQVGGSLETKAGGRYADKDSNPGRALVAELAVDDYCLVRSADGEGGIEWELYPLSAGGGTPAVSAWKEPVRVATTANGTLASAFENGDTVDGVTLATGDRILIKSQSSGAENGIYVVNASGAPTRAADADSGAELVNAVVAVQAGTANADTVWMCTTNPTITVGSTALDWAKLGPQVTISGSGSDNRIVRWDGTTSLQSSLVTISDGGNITGAGTITAFTLQAQDTPSGGNAQSVLIYGVIGGSSSGSSSLINDSPAIRFIDTGPSGIGTRSSVIFFTGGSGSQYLEMAGFESGDAFAGLKVHGAYAVRESGTDYAGLTTTRTVKDGSGNNQTVTIKGGIITGWTT